MQVIKHKTHTGLWFYKLQTRGKFFSKGTNHHRIYTLIHFSPIAQLLHGEREFDNCSVVRQRYNTSRLQKGILWVILCI